MRVEYTKAIAFIRDHGHFATYTADGIIARADVADTTLDTVELCGDTWFEEIVSFGVDDCGTVDVSAVRRWIGY
jgi:hypothetical protein